MKTRTDHRGPLRSGNSRGSLLLAFKDLLQAVNQSPVGCGIWWPAMMNRNRDRQGVMGAMSVIQSCQCGFIHL